MTSSCNEDAFALSDSGRLRRDLFYRLSSVVIEIPPLRERMEDLEELTDSYIRRHEDMAAVPITRVEPAFWQRLLHHDWPGNVRELFHILDYAVGDCQDGVLREENLPYYFLNRSTEPAAAQCADFDRGLAALVQDYKRRVVQEAFFSCGCDASKTADLLKISRQNFQYYIKKYGLHA